jgi:hypothetical protein
MATYRIIKDGSGTFCIEGSLPKRALRLFPGFKTEEGGKQRRPGTHLEEAV